MKNATRLLGTVLAVTACSFALVRGSYALSVSTSPITFPAVTLDGSPKTLTTAATWQVNAQSEEGGWRLLVSATGFSATGGRTIAVDNLQVKLANTAIARVSGDTEGPVSTQTSYAPLGSTPLRIASAADGAGQGVYNLSPDFRLSIPAQTYKGSYSGTVTIEVAAGP